MKPVAAPEPSTVNWPALRDAVLTVRGPALVPAAVAPSSAACPASRVRAAAGTMAARSMRARFMRCSFSSGRPSRHQKRVRPEVGGEVTRGQAESRKSAAGVVNIGPSTDRRSAYGRRPDAGNASLAGILRRRGSWHPREHRVAERFAAGSCRVEGSDTSVASHARPRGCALRRTARRSHEPTEELTPGDLIHGPAARRTSRASMRRSRSAGPGSERPRHRTPPRCLPAEYRADRTQALAVGTAAPEQRQPFDLGPLLDVGRIGRQPEVVVGVAVRHRPVRDARARCCS